MTLRCPTALVTAALALSGVLALGATVLPGATARADPRADEGAALIERTEWARWGDLSSLRVYPTRTGRAEAGRIGTDVLGESAWAEVLALAPEADLPGMREQFRCHWQWAEIIEPGKTSWNLEPWRPVVDAAAMAEAGCNPGRTEEPF